MRDVVISVSTIALLGLGMLTMAWLGDRGHGTQFNVQCPTGAVCTVTRVTGSNR